MGSKRIDLQYFCDFLTFDDKIKIIVEPFSGACAVSYYIYWNSNGKKLNYHINDIDINLYNFLNYININGSKIMIEKYNISLETMNKENYNKILTEYKNQYDPIKYFIIKKCTCRYIGLYRKTKKPISIDKYKHNDEFINKCVITNNDYKIIFDKYKDDENAFLFIDPPYFQSCNIWYTGYDDRTDTKNNIIDNTIMFIDIYNMLRSAKCKILLIINKNAITEYIYKDFIKSEYIKQYQLTKNISVHLICSNY